MPATASGARPPAARRPRRSRTTSDFDTRRARDSASISFTIGSGKRTVNVFMLTSCNTLPTAAQDECSGRGNRHASRFLDGGAGETPPATACPFVTAPWPRRRGTPTGAYPGRGRARGVRRRHDRSGRAPSDLPAEPCGRRDRQTGCGGDTGSGVSPSCSPASLPISRPRAGEGLRCTRQGAVGRRGSAGEVVPRTPRRTTTGSLFAAIRAAGPSSA